MEIMKNSVQLGLFTFGVAIDTSVLAAIRFLSISLFPD